MAKSGEPTGWDFHITGDAENPEREMLVVTRHYRPQIRLEVHVPGLGSVLEDQIGLARQAMQDAVNALQEALDSPSALPRSRPPRA